jgi:predicted Rossmann-fold nucleotide-binding protein
MGAADGAAEHVADAERLGELFARAGWVVLTGGRPLGVMEAALRGAKKVEGSLTIGIFADCCRGSLAVR